MVLVCCIIDLCVVLFGYCLVFCFWLLLVGLCDSVVVIVLRYCVYLIVYFAVVFNWCFDFGLLLLVFV